jgi:hypothetical protein
MASEDVGAIDNKPDLNADLRRLSQAPLSALTGWFELWNAYNMASHATLNLFGQTMNQAMADLTRATQNMQRQMHESGSSRGSAQ